MFISLIFLFAASIILFLLVKKAKAQYIYYSFLYYKKLVLQKRNFLNKSIAFVLASLLITITYLIADYLPATGILEKITPFLSDDNKAFLLSLKEKGKTIALILAIIQTFIILIYLCIFSKMPVDFDRKIKNELQLKKIINYKNVNIYSYFGSIEEINDIQVIVTSENSDLELASISSTSISGRVRNMAASKNEIGGITHDPLNDDILKFKSDNNKYNDFNLGTCVKSKPYSLCNHGVKCIIHAVAIKKKNDNTIDYDHAAVRKIISKTLTTCIQDSFDSVFIPIFCIGSAKQPASEFIDRQIESLKFNLDNISINNTPVFDIYLGVYRELDFLNLHRITLKTFG